MNDEIMVGQINCLGAGKPYGDFYGKDTYRLLFNHGYGSVDVEGSPDDRNFIQIAEQEKRMIKKNGLEITSFHSRLLIPWVSEEINVKEQERWIAYAKRKGAKFFLVHHLWEDYKCFDFNSRKAWLKQLNFDINTLEAVGLKAKEYGLRLIVENNPFFPPDYYLELIEELPEDIAGAVLDTGHINLQPHKKIPITNIIDCIGHRLDHLHLNDNDGKADQHLPLLTEYGSLDWREIFKALKNNCYKGVLNEELPTTTGLAWTVWSIFKRMALPLKELWHSV